MAFSTENVPIDSLIRDETLRFRFNGMGDASHEATIERYADAMQEYGGWGEFPPATVVRLTQSASPRPNTSHAAGSLVLVGGYSRTSAAVVAGFPEATATIVNGTWQDALSLAWSENTTHGRPRSSAELWQVVCSIKLIHPKATLDQIGKMAGCGKSAVWRVQQRYGIEIPEPAPKKVEASPKQMTDRGTVKGKMADVVTRDLWGRPLEGRMRELFAVVPIVIETCQKIHNLVVGLAERKHGKDGAEKCLEPGLRHVEVNDAVQKAFDLSDEIQSSIPWIVCPACDGEECDLCNDRGWLTKSQVENLEPRLEKKAKKWAQDRSGE